jgi:hypothetical protein
MKSPAGWPRSTPLSLIAMRERGGVARVSKNRMLFPTTYASSFPTVREGARITAPAGTPPSGCGGDQSE